MLINWNKFNRGDPRMIRALAMREETVGLWLVQPGYKMNLGTLRVVWNPVGRL